MLAQINPYIALEVAYRRDQNAATYRQPTDYSVNTRRPRVRRHLVRRVVRTAFVGH